MKSEQNPISVATLRKLVESVASGEGFLRESFHAANEHPERNISLEDVLAGLKSPDWVLEKTEYDSRHKNWKYLIKTADIEGDELHILISADPKRAIIKVITRW